MKCNFCQFWCSWKLRSGSDWSKRIASNLKRHWFEAVFVPTWRWWTSNAAGWPEHRPAPMGETENANTWHTWRKRDGKHPLDKASRANHELWNDDRSILFHSWVLQSAAPAVDSCMVNFCYFPCKDETDLFSRCFEYPAHACHIAQESRRCMSVTAALTNIGMVPNRLPAFFNASCGAIRCKNRLPQSYLSCFQNLYLTFGVKAESNTA